MKFFLRERLLDQPKATCVCVRSFVVSVLFARFHFKVIRKSLYPTLKANHYDTIRLQLERNDEFDDEGYARLPVAVRETSPRSSPLVEEQDRTREAGGNRT